MPVQRADEVGTAPALKNAVRAGARRAVRRAFQPIHETLKEIVYVSYAVSQFFPPHTPLSNQK